MEMNQAISTGAEAARKAYAKGETSTQSIYRSATRNAEIAAARAIGRVFKTTAGARDNMVTRAMTEAGIR